MFENSYLNRINLRCSDHPKSMITHGCTDIRCEGCPMFCQECMKKHYGHELNVVDINLAMEDVANRILKDKKIVTNIHKEIISYKPNEGLFKWQEEKEQHFMSIEKHINTLKFQIDQEIQQILKRFQEELENQKIRLYVDLETYYKNYREKFDRFSRMTEPIVSLNNKFKFYAHQKALIIKVNAEPDQNRLKSWLIQLKKTLNLTQKAVRDPEQYAEQIKKHGQAANEVMDELPRIRNVDYEVELPNILTSAVKEILSSLVKLKENKGITVCRSISMNNISENGSHKWKNHVQI